MLLGLGNRLKDPSAPELLRAMSSWQSFRAGSGLAKPASARPPRDTARGVAKSGAGERGVVRARAWGLEPVPSQRRRVLPHSPSVAAAMPVADRLCQGRDGVPHRLALASLRSRGPCKISRSSKSRSLERRQGPPLLCQDGPAVEDVNWSGSSSVVPSVRFDSDDALEPASVEPNDWISIASSRSNRELLGRDRPTERGRTRLPRGVCGRLCGPCARSAQLAAQAGTGAGPQALKTSATSAAALGTALAVTSAITSACMGTNSNLLRRSLDGSRRELALAGLASAAAPARGEVPSPGGSRRMCVLCVEESPLRGVLASEPERLNRRVSLGANALRWETSVDGGTRIDGIPA